jgi:hypothetical protein
MAMVVLLSLLELEGQTPSALEDMPYPPSQLSEEENHLEDGGPGHGHLGPAFLVFLASYRLQEDLGLGRNQGCC